MANMKKLKLKLKEKGLSVADVSDKNAGETFTVGDIDKISKILNLQVEEINEIFFASDVA